MESVRADEAERGLHGVGLPGTALPLLVIHRFWCTAASAEPPASSAKVAAAGRAARILHKALVEGLLERIRYRCRIEIHAVEVALNFQVLSW